MTINEFLAMYIRTPGKVVNYALSLFAKYKFCQNPTYLKLTQLNSKQLKSNFIEVTHSGHLEPTPQCFEIGGHGYNFVYGTICFVFQYFLVVFESYIIIMEMEEARRC